MDFLPWVTEFIATFDTKPLPGGSKGWQQGIQKEVPE